MRATLESIEKNQATIHVEVEEEKVAEAFGTVYTIAETSLEIKYGPFLEKIPLCEIQRVKRTRTLWSSAALSFDRLEIKYGYSTVFISPLDTHKFINELKQRCPETEFPGL